MIRQMEPRVIFQDSDILVLDKPSGMIVNKSDTTVGEKTVQEWVEEYLVIPNSFRDLGSYPNEMLNQASPSQTWLSPDQHDTGGGLPIVVDGGINDHTIVDAKNAGATRFVTTSFLFNNQDSQKQFEMLNQALPDQHDN